MRISWLPWSQFDELGLRRALADWTVPFLVAAITFLAALAVAGWLGAAVLSRHWQSGAGATFTVQVPRPGEPAEAARETRLAAVQSLLAATPEVDAVRTLSDDQVNEMLRPWLGTDLKDLAVPIPAVIAVHMTIEGADFTGLATRLAERAPGTILEDHAAWAGRLGTLAGSLQSCAEVVVVIVTLVTAAVIVVATRSGLAARREAIMIVCQLGATDSYIAGRFASRAAVLAIIGGAIGGLFALPVMFALTTLAAPFAGQGSTSAAPAALAFLPWPLWLLPVSLPMAAAVIGYVSTQITIRQWLRRLP